MKAGVRGGGSNAERSRITKIILKAADKLHLLKAVLKSMLRKSAAK